MTTLSVLVELTSCGWSFTEPTQH